MESFAIELKNITKRFGTVVANDNVNLNLKHGEILSLLGENGSGKTTLMNMLSGIYQPDEGSIFVEGKEVKIKSPIDSFNLHIGMIHQHFKLIDVFTGAENIILGGKNNNKKRNELFKELQDISDSYGFNINLNKKIYDMSVSEKQTVEIIKVLHRGADVLILDEPTAVLTPLEKEKLFAILENMRRHGKAVILITHKLDEVMGVSDRVTVLRKGKYIDTINTKDATESILTEMMVGEKISLNIDRPLYNDIKSRLEIRHVTVKDREGIIKLDDVSFVARAGEILGIAGIAGNGQKELLEAIGGLTDIEKGGRIVYIDDDGNEQDIQDLDTKDIMDKGIMLSFVPEDRFGMGLAGDMNIIDNVTLRSYSDGKGPFVDRKRPKVIAEKIVEELNVATPNIDKIQIKKLSGGNVQKVLVGREIEYEPKVLMSAYAVRGLDINTSYTIYNLFTKEKMKGVAVIYVGEDIDVLIELCDRILVLCDGKLSGVVDARKTDKDEIGLLMTKLGG